MNVYTGELCAEYAVVDKEPEKTIVFHPEPAIILRDENGDDIVKFASDGEVHFRGRKITKDEEIEGALRAFLIDQGYLNREAKNDQ